MLQQAEFTKYSMRSGLELVKRVDEDITKLTAIMRDSQAAIGKDGERA